MKTRIRTMVAAAVLAVVSLAAADKVANVYISANSKTYHSSRQCMSLTRSKVVYEVTMDAAKAHNLKPCGICYRPAAAKKTGNDWAKK